MKSLSILCLEDNEFDVELIKANIEANDIDFDLQHVETRIEFIKALKNGPIITGKDESAFDGQFDIILTDYSLPAFDGISALTMAAEMCPEVPIIMVSGAIGEEAAIEIMKKGATDYVLKQHMDRLVPTIMRALEEAEEYKARKLAEEALQESEKRLQTLINAMPDFICFKDGDGRWLTVNDAGTRIFRLEGIDYRGKKDSELAEFNSQLQGTFLTCKETDARAWEDGSLIKAEETISNPDGSDRIYDVTKVPVFYPGGERKGLIVLGHDITERVQAKEKIQESEEKFRTLFSTMTDGVYLHEIIYNQKGEAVDYRIIETNPASEKYLNIKQEDANGKLATDLYGTEEAPYLDIYAKVAKTGIPINFKEYFSPMKKYFNISVYSPGKGKFATVFQDITERVQAQENERQHFQNIQFLAESAMNFVDFPSEKNIYRFIGEKLKELAGESIIAVNSIDETGDILTTQAVLGMEKISQEALKILGRNPEGAEYNASNERQDYLYDGQLHIYQEGLYGIFLGEIPEAACLALEKLLQLSKIYTIGFVEGKRRLGSATFFFFHDAEFENEELVEAFVKQAAIAIQSQLSKKALKTKMTELEIFNDAAVDRELLINDSRKEINELLIELGREPKYIIAE